MAQSCRRMCCHKRCMLLLISDRQRERARERGESDRERRGSTLLRTYSLLSPSPSLTHGDAGYARVYLYRRRFDDGISALKCQTGRGGSNNSSENESHSSASLSNSASCLIKRFVLWVVQKGKERKGARG
jgi:hypothetical protein